MLLIFLFVINFFLNFNVAYSKFNNKSLPSISEQKVTFKKQYICLWNKKFRGKKILVEIADNPVKHQLGLMYRKKINKNEGMLFIFSKPRRLFFWMKNTFIPLSIAFFDENGLLFNIQEMKPVQNEIEEPKETYISPKKAKYALEMSQGWYKKNNFDYNKKEVVLKFDLDECNNK